MNEYLKMADVFNDKFDESMLSVNPECVKEEWDDGVSPNDHIVHAVKSHDSLVAEVERLRELLGDCRKFIEYAGFKHGFSDKDMSNVLDIVDSELMKK